MLKFKTDGQELFYLDGGDVIVGDTIRYLEAEFDLSDDWKSFPEVTAYFKCGAAINSIILIGGKIKAEYNLALAPGVWSVYLRAYELEGEEIKRQITSSTVKINVLSHGKFTGREFVPENADAYEKRMTEMRNYLVFEEYNPSKKYVKGNKVSYEGSSYVLTADSAIGTNPTDKGSWLCIAEKGDKGEQGVQGIKGEKGADGKDGKDGTLWIPFKFDVDIKKGEKKQAEFDFTRNIFRFGNNTYDDLDKNDFPNIYEWAVGDFLVSNNGNVLLITRLEWLNSEMLNFDAECILEAETIVVDESYNPTSSNPISGKAISEVFAAIDMYKANADLSNVSDEDFRTKAESAGVGGDTGLAGEGCVMKFMNEVSALPETANEGEVYKVDGYMNEYIGWAFESYDDTFKIYPDRIEFGTATEIYTEVFNVIYKANGATVNLELFNYDTGETHTIAATKAENNILYGATSVASGYVVGSGTMDFKQVGFVKKTCVRFNGEWVEL